MTAPLQQRPVLEPTSYEVGERDDAGAPRGVRRSLLRRWTVVAIAIIAAAVAVGAVAWSSTGEPVRVPLSFAGDPLTVESDWGNLEVYGVAGSYITVYRHDESITLRLPWDGDAVSGARLGDDEISLLTVDGVEQVDGVLDVTLAMGNCRFFHERELDIFTELAVSTTWGRERTVAFDRPLVIHSPMLASCPDRTIDRGDDDRGFEGRRG